MLTLEAQEGRLFKPLAYTKNFSMIVAAVLAITLDPGDAAAVHAHEELRVPAALAGAGDQRRAGGQDPFRGKSPDQPDPDPALRAGVRVGAALEVVRRSPAAVALIVVTVPVLQKLGSEFMPPLDEGTLLYMPSTLPGISVTRGAAVDAGAGPDHHAVPGSATRARQGGTRRDLHRSGAALDDGDHHRAEAGERVAEGGHVVFRMGAANGRRAIFRRFTPDHISTDQLVDEMNEALKIPGTSNAWTMPIKSRIDMLTTGIRTPVGIKIYGRRHRRDRAASAPRLKRLLPKVQGTRSVFAERTGGGYFLDFDWNRDELARYGLSIDDAQDVLMSADRRRERHHHRRGPRAVPGQRALHARLPQRHRRAGRACWCRRMDGQTQMPAGAAGRHSQCERARRCCATKTAC